MFNLTDLVACHNRILALDHQTDPRFSDWRFWDVAGQFFELPIQNAARSRLEWDSQYFLPINSRKGQLLFSNESQVVVEVADLNQIADAFDSQQTALIGLSLRYFS